MKMDLSTASAPEKSHEGTEAEKKQLEAVPVVNTAADYTAGYSEQGRAFVVQIEKNPTYTYKDEKDRATFEEVHDFDSVGMVIKDGFTVIDFDNAHDALIVLRMIDDLKLKTTVMRTNRGIHCYFKTNEREVSCFSHERLACGLEGDMKIGGHNAMDTIKKDGQWRECIRYTAPEDLEILPAFFLKVKDPAGSFPFYGMGQGERNQALYNYVPYLQQKARMNHEEVRECLMVINSYVLGEPVDVRELTAIYRDEAFLSDEEVQERIKKYETTDGNGMALDPDAWFEVDENGKKIFKHNLFGDKLMELYHVISYHDVLYIWDGCYYTKDECVIEKCMLDIWPGIKRNQRMEVLEYLKIKGHITEDQLVFDPYVVNLKNGRYNLKSGELMDFTPDQIEFSHLPVEYNPDAYSQDVVNLLDHVFCGRQELIDSFDDVGASMLIKKTDTQSASIFIGSGSNGKSTVLDMLETFLGEDNYSTLDISELGKTFLTAELEGKLANIGDDLNSDTPIKDTGVLKKVITGNRIEAQRKNEKPFTFKPYATHIYACNKLPRSFDKTKGFYRRFIILPFDAVFDENSPDFDPYIEDKITTPEAMSYLLNRFIKAAGRIIERGRVSRPELSVKMMDEYQTSNSSVLTWLKEECITKDHLMTTPQKALYEEFRDWTKEAGIVQVTGRQGFYEEIREKYGFDKKPKQHGDGFWYFVPTI